MVRKKNQPVGEFYQRIAGHLLPTLEVGCYHRETKKGRSLPP